MGIFSTKYKTTVGTSITRVIEDAHIPNSILTGVTKSIMNGDDQMIENTMEELISSIGVRANRMYDYGRRTYTNGIPVGNLLHTKSGEDLVKQVIAEEFGNVSMNYYHFGPLNNLHFGWLKLQDTYMYNPATNQLVVDGHWVYLVDMIVVVKEATLGELSNGSLDCWGKSPKNGVTENRTNGGGIAGFSPFEVDGNTVTDYLRVEYNSKNLAGVVEIGAFNIPVTGIDTLADYHHVQFTENGQPKYWLYRANGGLYPALDRVHDTEHSAGGSYFPWGYFRYNKKSLVDDKTTIDYKHNKRLMDFIGMDYDSVSDAINANEGIADVEQAMLMMAVPANSSNPMDVRYLFDFFNSLYSTQTEAEPNTLRNQTIQDIVRKLTSNEAASSAGINSLVIQDKKFKMTLDYRRITKTRRAGTLGKIGDHQGGYGVFTETVDGFTVNGTPVSLNSDVKYHYYRRQISPGIYEEIRVEGLTMKYHIFESYYETADENEDILLIPVDMAIVDNYSIRDREVLYSRSLHYVFNSRIITQIKWYQRGAFKWLMVIIAIVITIWSKGATMKLLLAAIAAGAVATATIILINLAIELLLQFLLAQLIKIFVKAVGGKVAIILAIVVVLYTGDINYQVSVPGAPFASELLSLPANLVSAAYSDIMKDKYAGLEAEYAEFADMVSSAREKLDKAKDELTYNNYLTPAIIFGEKPSEFYDRTVHSGNIGILSIDAISSYYDVALSLPKLNDSLGE